MYKNLIPILASLLFCFVIGACDKNGDKETGDAKCNPEFAVEQVAESSDMKVLLVRFSVDNCPGVSDRG